MGASTRPDSPENPSVQDTAPLLASTARPAKRKRLIKANELPQTSERPAKTCSSSLPAPSEQLASESSHRDAELKGSNDHISSRSLPDDDDGGEEVSIDQRTNDAICLHCDDGGEILLCDGPCMRSFHATEECNVLNIPPELLDVLQNSRDQFLCPFCLAGKHRCYACGLLGCSQGSQDETRHISRCAVATCGRFYHPECLGKTMVEAEDDPFACPLHQCSKCKGQESEAGNVLVPCRRCPVAYHEQCAPQSLCDSHPQRIWVSSEGTEDAQGIAQSLLYCGKHDIPEDRETPLFATPLIPKSLLLAWALETACQNPDLSWSKKILKDQARKVASTPRSLLAGKNIRTPSQASNHTISSIAASPLDGEQPAQPLKQIATGRHAAAVTKQTKSTLADDSVRQLKVKLSVAKHPAQTSVKAVNDAPAAASAVPKAVQSSKASQSSRSRDGRKAATLAGVPGKAASVSAKQSASLPDAGLVQEAICPIQHEDGQLADGRDAAENDDASVLQLLRPGDEERACELDTFWSDDAQNSTSDRVLSLADASISFRAVEAAARKPPPYNRYLKKTVDEARLAAYKGNVKLVDKDRRQLQTLTNSTVNEIVADEDRMRTILAPLLQLQRYTSYGRHFTKAPQMEAVVQRLQDFLRAGDTVVDFSCGANEFIPMVKESAFKSGIEVFGRAYDIITGRHFEDLVIKSWFDVRPEELPPGDRLVIGLNPPFGKEGSLADDFIKHAAKFAPRIIVLIVPPKCIVPGNYSVMYEDVKIMSDKAFYIPGGVQESWNVVAPSVRILVRRDRINDTFSLPVWSTRHSQPVGVQFAHTMPRMPLQHPQMQGMPYVGHPNGMPMPMMMPGPWPGVLPMTIGHS